MDLLFCKPVFPSRKNPYLVKDRHYYSVHVYDSREAMWRAAKKLSPYEKDHDGGFGAITIPYQRIRRVSEHQFQYAPKVGNILFHKGCIGAECVSHESSHAAIAYLRMLNLLCLGGTTCLFYWRNYSTNCR